MDMSIAAMSVNLSQARFSQQFGISFMKMAMDTTEEAGVEMSATILILQYEKRAVAQNVRQPFFLDSIG